MDEKKANDLRTPDDQAQIDANSAGQMAQDEHSEYEKAETKPTDTEEPNHGSALNPSDAVPTDNQIHLLEDDKNGKEQIGENSSDQMTQAEQAVNEPSESEQTDAEEPIPSSASNPSDSVPKNNQKLLDDDKTGKRKVFSLSKDEPADQKGNALIKSHDSAHKYKLGLIFSVVLNVLLALSVFVLMNAKSNEEKISNQLWADNAVLENELDSANSKITDLQSKLDKSNQELDKVNQELDEIENGKVALLKDIKLAFEDGDWNKVVTTYDKLHKSYIGSSEDNEAKQYYDQAKDELDKIAKAEQEKKEQEEKERQEKLAQGYETGITYDQIARNPDTYKDEKVKFSGKVLQVLYDSGLCGLRLAVNQNYNNVIYCIFLQSITDGKILEDDIITVYGVADGEYSYESTMGKPITLPLVYVDKIDQ